MSDTILQYRQCPCCGNYFAVSDGDSAKAIFCSAECRVSFQQCFVCGRYYETDKGFVPSEEMTGRPADEFAYHVCSEACAKVLLGHHKKG